MSTARKILSNTLWQILGKIVMAFFGLAVVKMSTIYLSKHGYGEYVVVYELLAFFGIAADLGLYTIAVREMSKDEDKMEKIIGNVLSLRTILSFVAMATAVAAVFLMPNYASTRIPLGVAIASVTVFLTIINGTITSVLQTKLKMHISAIGNVLGKAVSVAFMFYIVFYGYPNDVETGFYMLISAGILGNLVMLFYTERCVSKITKLEYRFDFDIWKDVFIKALPYGLALILNTFYFRINSILISFIRGQEEVGIYAVAMRILEQLSILPLYFMNSVLPVLTKSLNTKEDGKYKRIISYSFDFLSALSLPAVVGGFILAYPIIFIVSTPEFLSRLSEGFYGSDMAFKILIFASLFQFLNILFAFVLIALNKQTKLLYINGGCVIFNIILNLILIPKFGFRGAAFSSVLSEFFILTFTYLYAKKYLDFSLNFKNTFKMLFSALVMGATVYLLQPITYKYIQNWNVILLIFLGMIIYGALLFITKTISKDMIRLLKKEPPAETIKVE
ncbi:MAG: flippase [Candidatus Gracilibacteria bacterium]|jgi:O-antigen/teichoic acid export membrane protein